MNFFETSGTDFTYKDIPNTLSRSHKNDKSNILDTSPNSEEIDIKKNNYISHPKIYQASPAINGKISMTYNIENIISKEVYSNQRIAEFKRYLQLFGYKPESTILQVHIAGFFKSQRQPTSRELERRKESVKKYGGTTFVVVGRTHDPSIIKNVNEPKKRIPTKETLVM